MHLVAAFACVVMLICFGVLKGQAQQSTFYQLVGEWNHVGSGATGGHSIMVRDTGDVLQTGASMARVGVSIKGGGNFAFEGKDNRERDYTCVYFITFLGNGDSNWRVTYHDGNFECPEGQYKRISQCGSPSDAAQAWAVVKEHHTRSCAQ